MIGPRKFLLSLAAATLLVPGLRAQEPIRFARTPDISPDGKLVAFSYLGDIWTVEAIGGVARPVTMHQAHDLNPVFSPDGRSLAFSSSRHGSYDVFVVPAQGGKPRRLTFDSADDLVTGWSPDGKQVLFTSTRGTDFPAGLDLYTIPVEGGRERRVTRGGGRDGSFSPRGDLLAYANGPGTWYRKGYRGSSNDDIWLCHADGSGSRQVTTFNGQDGSPLWSADGRHLYYVSENWGTPANLVRQAVPAAPPSPSPTEARDPARPQLVTFHKDDGVRRARISARCDADGSQWIVYECGPEICLVSTKEGSKPRPLHIEVNADDKENTELTRTYTEGAEEFALSPDERHVAFSLHGQLFLMPVVSTGPGKATRLTTSAGNDHGATWSPDSQKILFLSDRNGHEDVYVLEPNDPEHPKLVEAHAFKVTQLTRTREPENGVTFAPDGKRVAFIRGGQLFTVKPDGTEEKVLVAEGRVYDYEWSPDSRWIAYAREDGSFASEIYVLPAAGGEARNVTRYATRNDTVTWSQNGKKLAFISQRPRGPGSMYVLNLQKPAAPGAASNSDIDWDDIHLRAEQAAPIPALEGAISPDGTQVAFRGLTSSGNAQFQDLWVASAGGGQITRVTTTNARPSQIHWSKRSPGTIYFRDGSGQLRRTSAGGGPDLASLLGGRGRPAGADLSGPGTIPFRVKLTIKREEEFQEMFDQSWRALAEHFYDTKFHGLDWYAVKDKYRPLVKHVGMKEDLYVLISLMLGELNASHLGISGFRTPPAEVTADLGLLFDDAYPGPGLKITEILKRGPADKRGLNLKPGEIVLALDGTDITPQTNLSKLLNDKINQPVVLQVAATATADSKARRRVEIQASGRGVVTDSGSVANLMYERWVEKNARRVAELSGNKVGYIHIPSMDEAGLDRFVRALYSDNFDKEAIVLDVRYNGGGFTHDQVLNYLGGKEHTFFRQRYGSQGGVLRSEDRKWTKPLVLLINNRSFSDAEIFPNAFRALGLGKLVGQPTGGFVIGTTAIRLIDGSMFRIPRVGVFTASGVNMEREGVNPDVLIEPSPDQLAKGMDAQLDKAVEVVQKDVIAWKQKNGGLTANK